MDNHAYGPVVVLRPNSNGPIPIDTLCRHFSPVPASVEDAAALNDLSILGVNVSSANTVPGKLFVGLPGFTVRGTCPVTDTIASNAAIALTDTNSAQIVHQTAPGTSVPMYSNPHTVVDPLSAKIYYHLIRGLVTTAVTETDSKTTTAYSLDAILSAHVGGCMVAGAVELRVGECPMESSRTTVEAPIPQQMVALIVEDKVDTASLEASSHAIILYRLNGIVIGIVDFTNLQRDRLDFHKTMENYLEVKAQPFIPEHARRGVVCVGDQWGAALVAEAPIKIDRARTYPGKTPAGWWASDAAVPLTDSTTAFTLYGSDGEKVKVSCPLPGLVDVQNAALALVTVIHTEVPAVIATMTLAGAHNIPDRVQRISQRDGRRSLCIVGFTHTPNTMELAPKTTHPTTPGRFVVVFGSDDDHNQDKRPMLDEMYACLADVLVVTDKDPRSEDPQLIRNIALGGVHGMRPNPTDVEEIAIWHDDIVHRGVGLCGPDNTVVATEKDHGPFLEIAGEFIRYNDVPVMAEVVEEKWGWA